MPRLLNDVLLLYGQSNEATLAKRNVFGFTRISEPHHRSQQTRASSICTTHGVFA